METGAANTAASEALLGALAAAGVRDACVTPGSRSTPLTAALARQSAIRPWLHLDERSAAFFGLGLARQSGRPVALVCTSGTAAANYYPAVVEANLSRIPLIVLTADRPPRLRNVGADQTIDQVGMFGSNARLAVDLPVPGSDGAEDSTFRSYAERAVRVALGPLPGPVHLNVPFEEPLLPPAGARSATASASQRREATVPIAAPSAHHIAAAAAAIRGARRPLIVAGPETGALPAAEIAALAAAIDAPILADALSGLRRGPHDRTRVLDSYDALLRDPRSDEVTPDCIIRFGAPPTSKALNLYTARQRGAAQVLCDREGSRRDPWGVTTTVVTGDPGLIAEGLHAAVGTGAAEAGWTAGWLARDRAARDAMQAECNGFSELFEGRVFSELAAALPADATIVAGNSMPVRDLDSFLVAGEKPLRFASNRGANGIDGVVSSALGAAAAGMGPVVLVIGDISFYHDMNGFWAAARHGLNLTAVLVNNNGGGIFHYLPQAAHEDIFEEWFGTPPDLDFSLAARMYGGSYTLANDWDTFRQAITGEARGLRIVELRTNRQQNTAMHKQAWAAAARAAWSETVAGGTR